MTPLVLSNRSHTFLERLDAKQYRQVAKRIFDLQRDASPQDARRLSGYPGYFRITIGEYRAIFCTKESLIEVTVIGNRNDDAVYKEFARI
jgi:mRNA interferase RelE/StbE